MDTVICRVARTFFYCLPLCLATLAVPAAYAQNYSDIWWNPNEAGWGLTLVDHETQLAGVWYTYTQTGKPIWYVMPAGVFNQGKRFATLDIYQTTGPAYNVPFNPSQVTQMKVGSAGFDFAPPALAPGIALFSYTIGSVSQTKQIQRTPFGNAAPNWGTDYSDIWWDPNQAGWGLAIAQHGNTIGGVWYTYGTDGQPLWIVMPGVAFTTPTSFSGTLYTATGPSFASIPFDPSQVQLTPVGNMTAVFDPTTPSVPKHANVTPVVQGFAQSKSITPTPFGNTSPTTSTSLEQQCAVPRPADAIDPQTNLPYGDMQGSLTTEKAWIHSYVNETYLWYLDVPPIDPSPYVIGTTVSIADPSTNNPISKTLNTNYDVVDAYFNSQRSPLFTASGKPKDQFHFTYSTADWNALSTSGNEAGFGFQAAVLAARPPRNVLVAYTFPGTPATQNNLARGVKFLTVNGVDVVYGSDVATLNEGLFSPILGKEYIFDVLDQGSVAPRTIAMTAATITMTPVQNVGTLPPPNNSVGYILFLDHIATAESELIDAVNQLKVANGGAGISDLVLDIRYNGGGYLALASELAYMIAGATRTTGKIFEQQTFNDKNPFGLTAAQEITPFYNLTLGFSITTGQPLPQLGLSRVYVITSASTCSASEAIINSLRGVGINVIQVGGVTCGKPYGFYPQDNCSTTYFTIQFKGVNNAGFGDYADGFIPAGTGTAANNLPGCMVGDDLTKQLGDPTESRLAAVLQYRADGTCPAGTASSTKSVMHYDPQLIRSALRENRFFRPKPPK
jgi:carboxyl-terminal processing protease